MKRNRRLGVFIAEVWLPPAKNVIQGIFDRAAPKGFDILVFTHFSNMNGSHFQIMGEENIYNLAGYAELDAAVIVGNRYQRKELVSDIEKLLLECGVPAVACEYSSTVFPSVYFDDRKNFCTLTEHLINAHQCRDIICLTGPENWIQSEQRLRGYCDACEKAGMKIKSDNIIYGDFWLYSAEKLAGEIISGKRKRPEAVVCANDIMAISLITHLIKAGIRIPDDIRVCGHDGTQYSDMCAPSLTTLSNSEYDLGADAAAELLKILSIPVSEDFERRSEVRVGDSCGCGRKKEYIAEYNSNIFLNDYINNQISRSTLSSEIYHTENISSFIRAVERHTEFFIVPYRYYLCLCEDWAGEDTYYRKSGYPEYMHQILGMRAYQTSDMEEHIFRTDEIIPCLSEEHSPEMYILTPLNYGDRFYGYSALRYENAETAFHHFYRQHSTILCSALENIRIYQNHMKLRQKLERYLSRDEMTGLYNKKGIFDYFKKNPAATQTNSVGAVLMCIENYGDIIGKYGENVYRRINAILVQAINSFLGTDGMCGIIKDRVFSVFPGSNTDTEMFCGRVQDRFDELVSSMPEVSAEISVHYYPKTIFFNGKEEFERKLEAFISLAEKYENENTDNQYSAKLKKLHRDIYRHPEIRFNIPDAASKIGISNSHFQRLYVEQFGISCKRDMIKAKTAKAKELLVSTELSVYEISEKCGYDSPTHFMKQFKSETGMTALQYRKSHS